MATTSNHEGLRGQALAEAVVAVVEQRPEQHNQTTVFDYDECGTIACLAGWTLILAHGGLQLEGAVDYETIDGTIYSATWRQQVTGFDASRDLTDSPLIAMHLLGIEAERREEFVSRVFSQMRREDAIAAFIEMTGIADVPDEPEYADASDIQDVIDDRKWEAFHEAGGHR